MNILVEKVSEGEAQEDNDVLLEMHVHLVPEQSLQRRYDIRAPFV